MCIKNLVLLQDHSSSIFFLQLVFKHTQYTCNKWRKKTTTKKLMFKLW
jgi:hypothetical protein